MTFGVLGKLNFFYFFEICRNDCCRNNGKLNLELFHKQSNDVLPVPTILVVFH